MTTSSEVQRGEWIWAAERRWGEFEEVLDTAVDEDVHNLAVADCHPHFLGDSEIVNPQAKGNEG